MLILLPNEIIIKISSYCTVNELCGLSNVNHIIAKLRLYRLCISNVACKRLCGFDSYSKIQYELNSEWFYPHNDYTLCHYISDLYSIFFNRTITTVNDYIFYKKRKYTLEYKHSNKIKNILNNTYILTKNNQYDDNHLTLYKRCHFVYRLNILTYNRLRLNNFNVLALIY